MLRITRREFLLRASALGAGAATNGAFDALAQTTNAPPLHVIVIGAGLAGLCSAYELEKRGHRVTILEADRSHVGGRTRTLRFGGGLYGEAGAMRIPTNHDLTRRYVGEFGLTLRDFVLSNPKAYYFLRGRRARNEDVASLEGLYRLRDDERGKSPDQLWTDSVGKATQALTDAERRELTGAKIGSEKLRALDQQSLLQVIQASGLSDEAIEYLAVTQGQETELWTAATETMREEFLEVWSKAFSEIVGGTDTLASSFASRLRSRPRMGCEVIRLTQDAAGGRVAAVYREGGAERRVEGDYLVCTLPFPVLSRVRVEPEFSGPKWRAIRELNYDSSTKVLFVCRRRFWESDDGVYGGGTYTDLPTGTTYYPSDNAKARDPAVSKGPGVMLASYSWGQAARRLASLPHAERAALVQKHLARVHPQLGEPGMVRQSASWSWDNHPYSSGAFAWFMPGQHTSLYADVIAPEGRIHIAGEHASLAHTWMQGALDSALRTVQAVLMNAQRAA